MDSYHILIDEQLIKTALITDSHEAADLFSPTLLLYILLLGLLPSILIYKTRIQFQPFVQELLSRLKLVGATLAVMLVLVFTFSSAYTSFFREHKEVRMYFNPANHIYATVRLIGRFFEADRSILHALGEDAETPELDTHRELIIMVVGETARADRFSLNGYEKDTNPLLSKENVISFTNVTSCGTLTAISVPCMFSVLNTNEYNATKAATTENVLDVLTHAGVNVLWRDNNSSSKGVADRVPYEDFRDSSVNPICDVECRDVGMLSGLQAYIDAHPTGDIMIVLHQMGNHGPAYYKRYPKEFERFTPVCTTNELSDCTTAEINNAYDNAITYTDYFLAETIELLKQNDASFETAMLYVSDHGESLGELGLFLHGMPNFVVPESQRHVPSILWLGSSYDEADPMEIAANREKPFSHDNVFHTILGFMEIESELYNPAMDLLGVHNEYRDAAAPAPNTSANDHQSDQAPLSTIE